MGRITVQLNTMSLASIIKQAFGNIKIEEKPDDWQPLEELLNKPVPPSTPPLVDLNKEDREKEMERRRDHIFGHLKHVVETSPFTKSKPNSWGSAGGDYFFGDWSLRYNGWVNGVKYKNKEMDIFTNEQARKLELILLRRYNEAEIALKNKKDSECIDQFFATL